MPSPTGRRLGLSVPRRFVGDLLYASRGAPIVTFERRMNLGELAAARKRLSPAPAWALLLAKGFGAVAARRPELRRTFLPFPCPHLWEADRSIASVAVEREYRGEPGVFFGAFDAPETVPLPDMMAALHDWKTKPVEEVRPFRRIVRYARLPWAVRRFLWWHATSWNGAIKAKNFGTFGVSLTGAAGATARNLIGPLTVALNTGVFAPDGTVDVRLNFDHRVLDGMPVARALAELEEALRTGVLAELRALAPPG